MAEIVFDRVHKRYGTHVAVNSVSFEVERGEFLSLLGPSGCGKTTLLRLVAGLAQADDGDIRISGRSMTNVPPNKRNVGIVFQSYALFPYMTVAENVAFGLEMRRVPRPEITQRVTQALATVRLPGYGDRMPHQLSGGQQQRVALARALVCKPAVLLLDEPLAALDKNLRSDMQIELKELQREVGVTTIFVTHDQEEALALSDRIIVMNGGAIEQIGTPEEIYRRPKTRFVLDFVGKANVLEGRIVTDGTARKFVVEGAALPIDHAVPTGDAILALRPEQVRLTGEQPDPARPQVVAEVANVVYLGDHDYYILNRRSGGTLTVSAARPDGGQGPSFPPGSTVWASWDSAAGAILPPAQPSPAVSNAR